MDVVGHNNKRAQLYVVKMIGYCLPIFTGLFSNEEIAIETNNQKISPDLSEVFVFFRKTSISSVVIFYFMQVAMKQLQRLYPWCMSLTLTTTPERFTIMRSQVWIRMVMRV